ncbi:MAG: LysR family transcriptional regulator [Candidatus Limnocylindrales bacterium]
MELRQLECFVTVATEGTYAAAADRLSIAQPALWRRVQELERELGVALFERAGRRVRLTTDGQTILDQATATLATADRLGVTARDLRAAKAGVLAIACASPHLRRFLAPVLGRFRGLHPGVTISIREYGGGAVLPGRGIPEDLLDGVVDLATGVQPRTDPRFDGFRAYDVHLVVPVADDHPWRDQPTVDIAALVNQPLVLAQHGSYSRRTIEAACRRAGIEPSVAMDSPSPISIVALAAAGIGVPIVVDDAIAQPRERPWPVVTANGAPIHDEVRLMYRSGARLSGAVQAFVELARQHARQDQESTSA